MSKERYSYEEFNNAYGIRDNERDMLLNVPLVVNMLNDNHKRIAELEEQLKNAILPKFKVGQEVWIIRGKENRRIDKCAVYGFVNNQCIRLRTSNRGHITRDLIYTFATKEEAQAKLEELKGE